MIKNNQVWASAETVRREWLTTFLSRKTAPKGAGARNRRRALVVQLAWTSSKIVGDLLPRNPFAPT